MSKFKVGTLVLLNVAAIHPTKGSMLGAVGVVEKEHEVGCDGYDGCSVDFARFPCPNGSPMWVVPKSWLTPINNPDIDLGEDTYMEHDTKANKPVKEST